MNRMRRERSGSMGMIEKWCKRKREKTGEEVREDEEENGRAREINKLQRSIEKEREREKK